MRRFSLVALVGVISFASGVARADDPVVEIRTNDPNVGLHRITGRVVGRTFQGDYAVESWGLVCGAPCNTTVPEDGYYFVGGPGLTRSSEFLLPRTSHVILDVSAGSASARMAGVLMTLIGSLAGGLIGGTLLLLGGVQRGDGSGLLVAGGVTLGAGALIAVPGIVLWLLNETHVISSGATIGRGPAAFVF